MQRLIVLAGFALLSGCASSAADSTFACDKTKWVGSYLAKLTERSGGLCGDIPEMVLIFTSNGGVEQEEGCTIESDVWSSDSCKHTAQVTCNNDSGGKRYKSTSTQVINQKNKDASQLAGIMTIKAEGDVNCLSTYDMTLARQ